MKWTAAREAYERAGVTGDIYLMAVGATQEGQAKTASTGGRHGHEERIQVFSPRLHVDLFGNQMGNMR
jgi:hypothetical protein